MAALSTAGGRDTDHAFSHPLSDSALRRLALHHGAGVCPGLPPLRNLAGPTGHSGDVVAIMPRRLDPGGKYFLPHLSILTEPPIQPRVS